MEKKRGLERKEDDHREEFERRTKVRKEDMRKVKKKTIEKNWKGQGKNGKRT